MVNVSKFRPYMNPMGSVEYSNLLIKLQNSVFFGGDHLYGPPRYPKSSKVHPGVLVLGCPCWSPYLTKVMQDKISQR